MSKAKAPVLRSLADLGQSPLPEEVTATQHEKRKSAIKLGIKPARPAIERIRAVKKAQEEAKPPVEAAAEEIVPKTESIKLDISIPEPKVAQDNAVAKPDNAVVTKASSEDAAASMSVSAMLEEHDLNILNPQEAPTEGGEVVVSGKAEKEERVELVNNILAYEDSRRHAELAEVYHRLATQQLRDIHALLEAEWGGSAAFKKLIVDIEARVHKANNDAMTKKRISALRLKYKEYHALASKVEKALGTDTVISGMKHTEYHKLLESIVREHSILTRGIREMADLIAFELPTEEDGENVLQPSNTEELVKVMVYIGTSAKRWMVLAAESQRRTREIEAQNAKLLNEVKTLSDSVKFERERYNTREEDLKKKAHRRFGMRFAFVNGDGMFLGRIPGTDKINPETLEMVGNIRHAMVLNDEGQVRQVYDKLRAWSREDSKYRKVMKRKGLHPDYLEKVEITLTRV